MMVRWRPVGDGTTSLQHTDHTVHQARLPNNFSVRSLLHEMGEQAHLPFGVGGPHPARGAQVPVAANLRRVRFAQGAVARLRFLTWPVAEKVPRDRAHLGLAVDKDLLVARLREPPAPHVHHAEAGDAVVRHQRDERGLRQ